MPDSDPKHDTVQIPKWLVQTLSMLLIPAAVSGGVTVGSGTLVGTPAEIIQQVESHENKVMEKVEALEEELAQHKLLYGHPQITSDVQRLEQRMDDSEKILRDISTNQLKICVALEVKCD